LAFWSGFFLWSLVATRFSSIVLCYAFFGTLLAVGCAAGLKYVGLGDLTVLICFGPFQLHCMWLQSFTPTMLEREAHGH